MNSRLRGLGVAAVMAVGLGWGAAASAAPLAPVGIGGGGLVTTVAQGCGPGFFRGPWSRCRPFGPSSFGHGASPFGRPHHRGYGPPPFRPHTHPGGGWGHWGGWR